MGDDAHPRTAEPRRRIGLSEGAVDQCRRHAPGLVHVVERVHEPAGDEITPSEYGSHPRQQQPAEDQLLDHRGQDGDRGEECEPKPIAAEEMLNAVGHDGVWKISGQGAYWIDRERVRGGREDNEGHNPPPDLLADASGLRVLGRPQPQRVTYPRPFERSLLAPNEEQDHPELPEQPHDEADQQRLDEWITAPDPVTEPGSDDPGENAHRDGRCHPHGEDLAERVLPYGFISITRRSESCTVLSAT